MTDENGAHGAVCEDVCPVFCSIHLNDPLVKVASREYQLTPHSELGSFATRMVRCARADFLALVSPLYLEVVICIAIPADHSTTPSSFGESQVPISTYGLSIPTTRSVFKGWAMRVLTMAVDNAHIVMTMARSMTESENRILYAVLSPAAVLDGMEQGRIEEEVHTYSPYMLPNLVDIPTTPFLVGLG